MDKSPEAFRTISEVADTLDTPAHVLRFWESRFPQIRPVKRAGGRRYYRPADVALLTGIKRLLHEEGLTIRGVQKILREQGVRHVSGMSGLILIDTSQPDPAAMLEEAMAEQFGTSPDVEVREVDPEGAEVEAVEADTAQVFALETALRRPSAPRHPTDLLTPDLFDDLPPIANTQVAPTVEPDPVINAGLSATVLPPPPEAAPESAAVAAPAAEASPIEPEPAPLTVSRGAMLRALPRPVPDDLRAGLPHLRDRLTHLRDRLTEAARLPGP